MVTPFALVAQRVSQWSPVAYEDKRGPQKWVAATGSAVQHIQLGRAQRFGPSLATLQACVKTVHQFSRGSVVDAPQRLQH
jgi:hypothetical protein